MNSKLNIILLIPLLFIVSMGYSQKNLVQNDSLNLYCKEAKKADKNLFLVFNASNCIWCRVMENYHNDSTVKTILSKYFLIKNIDNKQSKEGVELYKVYGKGGTPFWLIFTADGKWIIDSDNGNGNIGYPAKEDEIAHYITALKKSNPSISESECELLIAKLKEYNPKK